MRAQLSPLSAGWGKLQEVRRYLQFFRDSGKFTVAYMAQVTLHPRPLFVIVPPYPQHTSRHAITLLEPGAEYEITSENCVPSLMLSWRSRVWGLGRPWLGLGYPMRLWPTILSQGRADRSHITEVIGRSL